MARPAKPVGMADGHRTKKEISRRSAAESALMGSDIAVPKGLTAEQRKIAKHIIGELEKSKILCSLDGYVLEQCCVAADCLHRINRMINSEDDAMCDKELLLAKKEHERTFFKCCDELCLSPQARAKVAAANAAAGDESTQTLIDILSGSEDEE